jgi:hypothetical protein
MMFGTIILDFDVGRDPYPDTHPLRVLIHWLIVVGGVTKYGLVLMLQSIAWVLLMFVY